MFNRCVRNSLWDLVAPLNAGSAFCPDDSVSNGQLAVLTVRAWQVSDRGAVDNGFTDYSQSQVYYDAPPSHPFFKWIQKAFDLRIMDFYPPECGDGFCTERGQNCHTDRWRVTGTSITLPLVGSPTPSIIDAHLRPVVFGSMNPFLVYSESQQSFSQRGLVHLCAMGYPH